MSLCLSVIDWLMVAVTGLSTQSLLDHTDVAGMRDNEAIDNLCRISLDMKRSTYVNLNRLVA